MFMVFIIIDSNIFELLKFENSNLKKNTEKSKKILF